jgi:hypothetical protein
MDITVTPAAEESAWARKAWNLTDLLGRSMGRIVEEPQDRFTIQPDRRARETMARVAQGPHPSLDAALTEIEKHTHGICRLDSENGARSSP